MRSSIVASACIALAACLLGAVQVAASPTNGLVKRIINGFLMPKTLAPYGVSVTRWDAGGWVYMCGGTIIAPNYVLTAAHCIYNSTNQINPASTFQVGYGSMNKTQQVHVWATEVHPHPQYYVNGKTDGYFDLALIKVPNIPFGPSAQQIPIYMGDIQPLQGLMAMGWGRTEPTAVLTSILRGVLTMTGTISSCQSFNSNFTSHNGPLICTIGDLTPDRTTCGGDSGSPVVINLNGVVMLAGLNSMAVYKGAMNCGAANSAHMYIHPAYYMDFINKTTGLPSSFFAGQSSKNVMAGPPAPAVTVTKVVVVTPTNMPTLRY